MLYAYKHRDGRVKLYGGITKEALAERPFCERVIRRMDRAPRIGERVNDDGEIVEDLAMVAAEVEKQELRQQVRDFDIDTIDAMGLAQLRSAIKLCVRLLKTTQ